MSQNTLCEKVTTTQTDDYFVKQVPEPVEGPSSLQVPEPAEGSYYKHYYQTGISTSPMTSGCI